jgi:hypothetical protein
MTITEYRKNREESMKLIHMIIEKIPKENLSYAGKMLGMMHNGTLMFEDEFDSSVLMDYCIYEKNSRGKRFIDEFYDSDIKLKSNLEDLLEGKVDSTISLYEVKSVNPETSVILLTDLLTERASEIAFMDLGLSQTAKIGMVFFTRIIPIGDSYMSSGVSFAFAGKTQLLKDIALAKYKKNGRLSSSDLYLLMYKKYKTNGLKVISREV